MNYNLVASSLPPTFFLLLPIAFGIGCLLGWLNDSVLWRKRQKVELCQPRSGSQMNGRRP